MVWVVVTQAAQLEAAEAQATAAEAASEAAKEAARRAEDAAEARVAAVEKKEKEAEELVFQLQENSTRHPNLPSQLAIPTCHPNSPS